MDLSKIPEPSEDEIDRAGFLVEDQQYFKLTDDERILCRIIAHLLRHGSVLAAFAKRHGMHRSSVEFFEKFGGNDER